MAEYIDRKTAFKRIKNNVKWANDPSTMEYAADLVLTVPVADVVEVVRCKDCKNLSVHTNGGFYCRKTGIEYKSYECEEHYCSYAVKTDKKRGKDWKRKVSTG